MFGYVPSDERGGTDESGGERDAWFRDPKLVMRAQRQSVDGEVVTQEAAELAREFLLSLVLCNTVNPQRPRQVSSAIPVDESDAGIMYQAGSPDEAALVEAARRIGVVLQSRQGSLVRLSCSRVAVLPIKSICFFLVVLISSTGHNQLPGHT